MEPEFPISLRFENGEVEEYEDVDELIHNLEDFDLTSTRPATPEMRVAGRSG